MAFVPVLRLDPDLAGEVPEDRRALAMRSCLAEAVELPKGEWDGELAGHEPSGMGLLVLSGTLCRRVVQQECYGAELLGPGDLLRPWDQVRQWTSIPTESSWTVFQPIQLAVLDAEFARRASRWPEIGSHLLGRALMRSRYLAILVAIISQRRIETRLTMLFWHLADRFGQMRGEWIEIPLPLTHSLLGEVVAARRPTVTTALTHLQERGVLRRSGGGWCLASTPPPALLEAREEMRAIAAGDYVPPEKVASAPS
jgi:CRP-like cAMP-binding protein